MNMVSVNTTSVILQWAQSELGIDKIDVTLKRFQMATEIASYRRR